MTATVRIDKYLWAIRVFKTRSEATDACNGNKVRLGGVPAKPGKTVKPGDLIEVRKGVALFTFRVLQPASNRMGASLVPGYAEDLTPESELEKFRPSIATVTLQRDKGAGRPTKKDRRSLDALLDEYNNYDE